MPMPTFASALFLLAPALLLSAAPPRPAQPPALRPSGPPPVQPAAPAGGDGVRLRAAPFKSVAMNRFELPNGVGAIALRVPDAPRQAVVTILPFGSASDPAGEALWSNLLAAVLVESAKGADAAAAIAPAFESRAGATHLETLGDPADFAAMIAAHARWIGGADIAPDSATIDRARLATRTSGPSIPVETSQALAAWNQAIRHGRDEIAIRAAFDAADPERVATALRDRLGGQEGVLVATIGPLEFATVRDAIQESIGKVPARTAAPAEVDFRHTIAGQTVTAQWDLPGRRVLLWWPLSGALANRVDLEVGAACLRSAIMFSQPLGGAARGSTFVETFAPASAPGTEATLLIDLAPAPGEFDPEAMREQVLAALSLIADGGFAMLNASAWQPRMMMPTFGSNPPPYSAQQRAGLRALGPRMEAQWMINTAFAEHGMGMTRDEAAQRIDATTPDGVRAWARALLAMPPRTLVLEPKP